MFFKHGQGQLLFSSNITRMDLFVAEVEQSFPVEKSAAIGGVRRSFSAFSKISEVFSTSSGVLAALRHCSLFIQLVELNPLVCQDGLEMNQVGNTLNNLKSDFCLELIQG